MAVLGVRIKGSIYVDSLSNAKARFDQCCLASMSVGLMSLTFERYSPE